MTTPQPDIYTEHEAAMDDIESERISHGLTRGILLCAVSAAAPAPAVPQGWNLVPIEPTKEMLDAVVTSMDEFTHGHNAERQYREDWSAMLAAAPASVVLTDEDLFWLAAEHAISSGANAGSASPYFIFELNDLRKFIYAMLAAAPAPAPAQEVGLTDEDIVRYLSPWLVSPPCADDRRDIIKAVRAMLSANCGCRVGECESKSGKRCRMTVEIAAIKAMRTSAPTGATHD